MVTLVVSSLGFFALGWFYGWRTRGIREAISGAIDAARSVPIGPDRDSR